MNRQLRKNLVNELVTTRRLSQLVEMARSDRRVIGSLCGLLYDQDDLVRWRTIQALGAVSAAVAETNLQIVRELLRRLEWLMNDESGGAGWHSPEAMAAIVVNVPELIEVFGVLLGAYLHDDALSRGAHWGVAAVSKIRPDLLADRAAELQASLASDDPFVRGYALVALTHVASGSVHDLAATLYNDSGALELYSRVTGEMSATTVGDLARLVNAEEDRGAVIDVW